MKSVALTTRPLAGKVRRYFWVLLFATYSVGAAGVMIDVLADEYRHLSQVAVTTAVGRQTGSSILCVKVGP